MFPNQFVATFLMLAMLLAMLIKASGIRVENLVVFGDSYSDAGSFKRMFTNGPLWHQDLAYTWNTTVYDFAVSGAKCIRIDRPGVQEQINAFCGQALPLNPRTTVYALWIGINDISAIVADNPPSYNLSSALTCVKDAITSLTTMFGAENILVITAPPLQLFPFFSNDSAHTKWIRHRTTVAYNTLLNQTITGLRKRTPSSAMVVIDTYQLIKDILQHPADYGFNSTQGTTGKCAGKGYCPEADSDFFWDSLHISGAAHRIVANRILVHKPFDAPNAPITNTSLVHPPTFIYPKLYKNTSATIPACIPPRIVTLLPSY